MLASRRDYQFELLVRDGERIRFEDPGVTLQHLAERPEGDSFPIREASAVMPGDAPGRTIDPPPEFGDKSSLADPGLADHDHKLHRPRFANLGEDPLECRQLVLAADERRIAEPDRLGLTCRLG